MTKELLQQALDALTRLSFLGNGDFPGNSEGNRIAQKAVSDIKQALAQQEPPASVDAYNGAREDVAIWKKRALEAEELNRKFIAEVNGPTYLGEPVKQEQPAQEPVAYELEAAAFANGKVLVYQKPEKLASYIKVRPLVYAGAAPTQQEQEPLKWYDDEPPFPQNQESFIALTTYGDRVVLRALPEEHPYDYTTADGTYMQAKCIKRWMQFPDCGFIPPESLPTQPALSDEELKALLRFSETCEDGEGYDVPKPMMQRLAVIGVVRRVTGSIYEATEIGVKAIEAHCRGGANHG